MPPFETPGSVIELVAALSADDPTPILLRGSIGSGRSSVVRSAANTVGSALAEYEAALWTPSTTTPPLRAQPPAGLILNPAMATALDDARTFAVLHDGDDAIVVVDHLDPRVSTDILEAMEWMARRVRVIGIVDDPTFATPQGWRTVTHGVSDIQTFWSNRPQLRVIDGDAGVGF